ncbi:organic hydroperoxide resistance protein [Paracoccus sp. MKU1]|uniref:organic hydroperoxide resistance protein n=1 Tax=Paracoccus sp. MKU1 TaxID=1745182 RepID=UPI0007190BBD|nr:organic hydroperoxide resistance protein [Paracoccus sp. MKU1]KRW95222.1 organic hydroperoxide resistance protein [Paracoccus sp. MKU1]
MTPEKILYQAEITVRGDRDGRAEAPDGSLTLDLAMPRALGGSGGAGTNPEQLFAAGYAACFAGAVRMTARQRKIALPETLAVTARVGIGPIVTGYALAVELIVDLPGIDRAIAEGILAEAHATCPYSDATRGNIDVTLGLA